MAGIRQPRAYRRAEPAPVRIQERDRFILEALAKMRFLTTTQIAELGFAGSRWAAHKRLRKLLDAGLLRVWLRSLNHENVYSLDRRGVGLVGDGQPVPRSPDGNLDHLLSINQVRIAIALRLPAMSGVLVRWRSDWELRAEFKTRVIPDALFEILWNDAGAQRFALEVDHRSRSTRGFARKVLGYAATGALSVPVLFIGQDRNWVERYRQTLAHTRLAPKVWFTTFKLVDAQGLCAPVFQGADSDEQYSLRDIASLPYGKEGYAPDFFESTRT